MHGIDGYSNREFTHALSYPSYGPINSTCQRDRVCPKILAIFHLYCRLQGVALFIFFKLDLNSTKTTSMIATKLKESYCNKDIFTEVSFEKK